MLSREGCHKEIPTSRVPQEACRLKNFAQPIPNMLPLVDCGEFVQSAASQLLEQVDALLRCLPKLHPMSGQAMEGTAFLTPDDYTPAR